MPGYNRESADRAHLLGTRKERIGQVLRPQRDIPHDHGVVVLEQAREQDQGSLRSVMQLGTGRPGFVSAQDIAAASTLPRRQGQGVEGFFWRTKPRGPNTGPHFDLGPTPPQSDTLILPSQTGQRRVIDRLCAHLTSSHKGPGEGGILSDQL